MQTVTYQNAKRQGNLQVEGLIVRLKNSINIGFVYCRSTPNDPEIKAINKYFDECKVLMGDFNLSHRISKDQIKVQDLCQNKKESALNEITRSISNNQLDYILIEKLLNTTCFVTSFNNFISDHKSITARIGMTGNMFSDEFKERNTFDSESHLKAKQKLFENSDTTQSNNSDSKDYSSTDQSFDSTGTKNISDENEQIDTSPVINQPFRRKFHNVDWATCWLNSCLQLILNAIDHCDTQITFSSELGKELLFLQLSEQNKSLDPTTVKNIVVTAEDTRIATRISELEAEVTDQIQLENQITSVQNLRLNLLSGQQCVRDFFLCLNENVESWPDVYSHFGFKITHSTTCCACNHINQSDTLQMYAEIPVPPDGSNLNDYVEEFFNTSTLVGRSCEDGCQGFEQSEIRSKLTLAAETEFFIVILTRAVQTIDGFKFDKSRISATTDVFIR